MVRLRGWSGVLSVLGWCGVLSAGALGGCGPTQPADGPSGQPTSTGAPTGPAVSGTSVAGAPTLAPTSKSFDACEGGLSLSTRYSGVLQDARCDEERFPIMADTAKMLGVDCRYCHVPHPTDPKKELYPVMTPKKEVANWMRGHLMKAIKPADGSELRCQSCHLDKNGKAIAKILGNPRDEVYAHEWMSLVMTTKFVVAATGEKLKCKSCHVGNYKTSEWQAKVILTDHIPAH
jgi:hypothetical protein